MKANKQGISLIVLVITIVVVIILAAAVILSLNGNNPIDNARIANFAQTKDGLYSAIYTYEGTVQGKTQGYFTSEQIYLGTGVNTTDGIAAPAGIVVGTPTEVEGTNSKTLEATTCYKADKTEISLYKLDGAKFKAEVGEDLPATPVSNAEWYIDAEGQVYIVFSELKALPSWMGKTASDITSDVTLNKTVVFLANTGL